MAVTVDPQVSEREREILCLIATGATNQRIARELSISVNTVKVHIRNIFGKLGAASRAEATVCAIRGGLLTPEGLPSRPVGQNSTSAAAKPLPGSGNGHTSANQLAHTAPSVPRGTTTTEAPNGQSSVVQRTSVSLTDSTRQSIRSRIWYLLLALSAMMSVAALVIAIQRPAELDLATSMQPIDVPTTSVGTAQRWRPLAEMPEGRAAFAIAGHSYEGKQYIYVMGGELGGIITDQVLRYDQSTDFWVPMSSKPTPAADVRAAVIGSRVYVAGGRLQSGEIDDRFEAYDPQRDRWTTLASLPEPRSGYALATVEGKLYLIGGWDGAEYRAEVWQYSPDEDVWRQRTPMPTARAFAAVGVVGERICVVGGEGYSGELAATECYSPSMEGTGSPWSTRAPSITATSRGDAAAVGGLFMLVEASTTPGRLFLYSPHTDSWRASDVPLGKSRDLRVHAIGNWLYIVGGRGEDGESGSLYEYQAISTVFLPAIH